VLLATFQPAAPGADSRGPIRPGSELRIALTGDTILTRPLSGHSEPEYLALLAHLRGADATFTNLETLFHDFEGPAMPSKPALRSDPGLARDLAWAGFDLVARANNHAADYGFAGVRETTRHAAAAGLIQAGAGESLAAARRAGLFRGAAGTVALISAASTFPDYARAGNARGSIPARPGINPLRVWTTYLVSRGELARLRKTAQELGLDPPAEGALDLGGLRFDAGDSPRVSMTADTADQEAIAAEVRRASAGADYTLVSIHSHERIGANRETPPEFLIAFARAMIDAGADLVVGHGPHVLRGIELYRGRPIFYGLGNFLFQYETVSELPADDYESVDLPDTSKPDDFFDRYDQKGARGYPADAEVWESAVALTRWREGRLEALDLLPISLGFGLPRRERGRPVLASPELSRKILERLSRLSAPFGTKVEFGGGVGRVVLTPP
jgi:poly-gamma-glutamate capsule biosynthesis protein CapA/YwtB (metallophosphatase superfamily)